MSRTVVVLIGTVFGLSIIAVTTLLALGRDAGALIQLLATILIPGVISLVTLSRVEKVKDTAEQAVENTNGRMTELIQLARENGSDIPAKYADLEGDPTLSYIPDTASASTGGEYAVDENGKPYLRRDV